MKPQPLMRKRFLFVAQSNFGRAKIGELGCQVCKDKEASIDYVRARGGGRGVGYWKSRPNKISQLRRFRQNVGKVGRRKKNLDYVDVINGWQLNQFARLSLLNGSFSNPLLPNARQARRLRCDKETLRGQIDANEGSQALRVDRQEPLR